SPTGAMPGQSPPAPSSDPRLPGNGVAAYRAWRKQTGRDDLSFADWSKSSQANWFKDQWAKTHGGGQGVVTQPASPPGGETVAPAPGQEPAQGGPAQSSDPRLPGNGVAAYKAWRKQT